jgi:hypothetical protein
VRGWRGQAGLWALAVTAAALVVGAVLAVAVLAVAVAGPLLWPVTP